MPGVAYKEWAVVVRALLTGEQLLDLRKGGLHERGRHFELEAERFWLFPTVEHQQPELVKPPYRRWVDESARRASSADGTLVEGWADVAGVVMIDDPTLLEKLDSKVVWTNEYAQQRLSWRRRDPLWVLALRVHRLVEPIIVRKAPSAGCSTWLRVDELPDDPASIPGAPAVSSSSFDARLQLVARDLGLEFEPPATHAASS